MSRFNYVKYDDTAIQLQNEIKQKFEELEASINKLSQGRASALALTKLEESYMWVGKQIRDEQILRNGYAEPQEERKDG